MPWFIEPEVLGFKLDWIIDLVSSFRPWDEVISDNNIW